ncbi:MULTISPECIES: BTAD domain-containing putative transcriptional regulator [unclassified Streptomyces]|uniref:AfsR/SARP family transcriptional regulator n=1 Tax=unclassified Streptomyces TaxID=2593676 RepID=UPI001E5DCD5A|nr:BTAD domain-containing putative transcriptional regulator [Streptomyces sp. CB02980]MCB8901876.1 tetratricopeptide repeat protein [Streptomyces sp. CB02980]
MSVHRGETPITIGSPQQQALLVALLLRSGRVASTHELIVSVWGEEPPSSALASLRTYVWRLRQLLEEDSAEPRLLLSQPDGYRMVAPPLSVDLHRAEQLAVDAGRARAGGDGEACGRLLAEALGLWQGAPLAGVPGPYAEQQRARFTELRIGLEEERFAHELQAGRYGAVIPDLTVFTQEHPLQERPYGFLMRALYASGRQADALAVYARARRVLAEELGVDPGPELTALHERVLAGDPLLDVSVRGTAPAAAAPEAPRDPRSPEDPQPSPALRTAEPDTGPTPAPAPESAAPVLDRPAQLPADAFDFTGRAEQVEELSRVLTAPDRTSLPVASISGMGGLGKTTLALRVAHRIKHEFPDGQLYVDLRGSGLEPADPSAVLGSMLAAMGVPPHALPAMTDDRARLLRTLLDGRRMLLLLDNARDPAQVVPLLPGSAGCAVIVTSRTRLVGIPSAVTAVALEAFATDEAIELLTAIVGAARVAAEPAAATDLVTACGHLPLAVRIVAARLAARPRWQIETMTRRLADERRRIGELRAGDLAVAATFELGYRQLPQEQACAFQHLAPVARPSIGLEVAAAALGLDAYDAEEILESLVDAAMLEAPQPGRYRYHDLVWAFALQLGVSPGDGGAEAGIPVLPPLLDHLLAAGRAAFQCMVPGDPDGIFLTPGSLAPGSAPAPHFAGLAEARAWVTAEFECLTNAVMLAARSPAGAAPRILRVAADLLIALTPFGKDIPYGQLAAAAQALAETAALRGDDHVAGRARFVCGNAALQSARLAEAELFTRLAAEACERVGDRVILRQTLNDRGLIAQFQHRYEDAVHCYDQAIDLAEKLGHRSGELVTRLNAAQARLRGGRAEEALVACAEALAALREVEDHHGAAYALYVQGMALHELGRYDEAVASHAQCLRLCEAWQFRGQESQTRFRLAETLRITGRREEAVREASRALVLCEQRGAERDQGLALLVLGRTLADLGDFGVAAARARQAHTLFTRLGLPDADHAAALLTALGEPL